MSFVAGLCAGVCEATITFAEPFEDGNSPITEYVIIAHETESSSKEDDMHILCTKITQTLLQMPLAAF